MITDCIVSNGKKSLLRKGAFFMSRLYLVLLNPDFILVRVDSLQNIALCDRISKGYTFRICSQKTRRGYEQY